MLKNCFEQNPLRAKLTQALDIAHHSAAQLDRHLVRREEREKGNLHFDAFSRDLPPLRALPLLEIVEIFPLKARRRGSFYPGTNPLGSCYCNRPSRPTFCT